MAWLSLLGPFLMQCFSKITAESAPSYVAAHYNATTDTFDPGLVADAMPQAYRAVRHHRHGLSRAERKKFVPPSRDEVRAGVVTKLKEAMNADSASLKACAKVAAGLPDPDEFGSDE